MRTKGRGAGGRRTHFAAVLIAGVLGIFGACSGEDSGVADSCERDEDCGTEARCSDALCVADPMPRLVLTTETTGAFVGTPFVVDASASRWPDGARVVPELAIEPPLAASIEPDTDRPGRATIEARPGHEPFFVVARAQSRAGRPIEARVEIGIENRAPTLALRAEPEVVEPGESIALFADASDPDEDELSFTWSLEEGPGALDANGATAQLHTDPTSDGETITVKLIVSDGFGGVMEADYSLTPRNRAPRIVFVDPGEALHRCEGTPLVCTAVVPLVAEVTDRSAVTFSWRFLSGMPGVHAEIATPDAASCELRLEQKSALPITGSYTVELTAIDEEGAGSTVEMEVRVGNRPPIVRAHDESPLPHLYVDGKYRLTRPAGAVLTYEDPDGDPPVRAEWRLSDEALALTEDGTADSALVIESADPEALKAFTLTLIAADLQGGEASDSREVHADNRAPVLTADAALNRYHRWLGPNLQGDPRIGETLGYFAASDPDGDPVRVTAALSGNASPAVRALAPTFHTQENGEIVFEGPLELLGEDMLVEYTAEDPFGLTARAEQLVHTKDRKPSFVASPLDHTFFGSDCATKSCCFLGLPGNCPNRGSAWVATSNDGGLGAAARTFTIEVSDPDGDPVTLHWSGNHPFEVHAPVLGPALNPKEHVCAGSCKARIVMLGFAESPPFTCAIPDGSRLDAPLELHVEPRTPFQSGTPASFELSVIPSWDGTCDP